MSETQVHHEPVTVTVDDLDAVKAALVAGGGYRPEHGGVVAQTVDWLARAAINALLRRGWRPPA